MSIDEWIDKEDVKHMHKGLLLSCKKELSNASGSNMDGPRDYYNKWSQIEKDKYCMTSFICRI